ncbi:hypothetical protein GBL_3120 [Geobacillus kaustophilus GBlys]|uniref:Uncharacterized protein n=2 Tax=Geobacillus TaxID=129337 RepID=A0A1Q5T581_9BACL|nr:hypothetical protein BRO54_1035 [Geobacillus proteiniphilus]GAD14903.1 hypothetical protein GBL_3120 [Geobacillus kaustophilus GBlys]
MGALGKRRRLSVGGSVGCERVEQQGGLFMLRRATVDSACPQK